MARAKKDGVNINYFIRRDVKEKLDAYCEEKGQTATLAIERILEGYLDEYFKIKAYEDNSKKQKNWEKREDYLWHYIGIFLV